MAMDHSLVYFCANHSLDHMLWTTSAQPSPPIGSVVTARVLDHKHVKSFVPRGVTGRLLFYDHLHDQSSFLLYEGDGEDTEVLRCAQPTPHPGKENPQTETNPKPEARELTPPRIPRKPFKKLTSTDPNSRIVSQRKYATYAPNNKRDCLEKLETSRPKTFYEVLSSLQISDRRVTFDAMCPAHTYWTEGMWCSGITPAQHAGGP
eukprot:5661226-Amphidinium_carterae.1